MGFLDIAMKMLEARKQAAQPQPPRQLPTVVADRRDPQTGLIMTETSNIVQRPDGSDHLIITKEPRRPTVTIGTAYGEAAPVAPPTVSTMSPGDAIAQAAGVLKKKK